VTKRTLIVFDLDGTIVDSREDLADSTNEMLASYGAGPLAIEAVTAMVGEGARMLVVRALRAAAPQADLAEALARFREIYDRRLLVHTRPYHGLPAVLDAAAARAALAVLTNKPEAPARRLLDAFGLSPRFAYVVGGDSGFPRKPDPAGLAHLMLDAKSTPERTLVIGDSNVDWETARRAGASFCAARYGFGRLDATPVAAATPADLHGVIDAFVAKVEFARNSSGEWS
jgi:phosphoglycolate phosphatase